MSLQPQAGIMFAMFTILVLMKVLNEKSKDRSFTIHPLGNMAV